MSLAPGTRVGPYEITGQLGAGGMGEVCRARDTKLNREVALKVLPDAFAADPDRMSRFQREAQLLAALNHPNIAAIYGLEDAGPQPAIVMELVEGRTLAGPLPVADALPLAKQIAEAIEYAHDRGIIHRDLKPANIKVSPDGTVKVLDFGLAKAMDDSTDPVTNVLATMSPTLSLAATHAGVILGTAAYMAPEQAKGKPADRRSDIWAFGIVLYEMLTGGPVFGGDSVPETLASVMKDPIAFGKLPDDTPLAIRKLVSRCLERDPRRRLQSIGEARIVIDDAIAGVVEDTSQPAPVLTSARRWPWALATVVASLAALAAIGWNWSRPVPPPPAVARFTVPPPEGTIFTSARSFASNQAISPDGRYVAFLTEEPGRERHIWVRAINSLSAQRLDRTDNALYPFWSPDSREIAYFANSKLMRISVAGGAPITICDAPEGEGGAWFQSEGRDGVIVFAPEQNGPLKRVLAQGGVPTTVTKLGDGEVGHVFPQFLPDGRILYLARGANPGIWVQRLDSTDRQRLMNSLGRVQFSPPGVLLYLRDNTLLAHRLNLATLQLEGEPISIAEEVRSGGGNGRNAFTVSDNGVLAYRAGGSGRFQLTWYVRDGKRTDVAQEAGENGPFELTADDRLLAVEIGTGDERDLWVKDLTTGVLSPGTTARGADRAPVWSPDARRLAYIHEEGTQRVLRQTTIGSGKHTEIKSDGKQVMIHGWMADGKFLLTSTGRDVTLLPVPGDGELGANAKPQTLFSESYQTSQFRVSPDGKLVAYTSQESGQTAVILATFPTFADRRQISSANAAQPLWRSDGKELFFLGRNATLMAVDVKTGPPLEIGPVRTMFQVTPGAGSIQSHTYAASRDGQRFLFRDVAGISQAAVEQLHVVTNWTSLLGR